MSQWMGDFLPPTLSLSYSLHPSQQKVIVRCCLTCQGLLLTSCLLQSLAICVAGKFLLLLPCAHTEACCWSVNTFSDSPKATWLWEEFI